MSGVDTETRGLRLFQGRRPIEIGTVGDMAVARHNPKNANELAVVTRPLCDMAKTANPCQPVEFRPHFLTASNEDT